MKKTFLLTSEQGLSHYMLEDANGTVAYETIGEVDPVLDYNQALRTANDGYSPSREMRRVASIPYILINKWHQEEGWNALDPEHHDKLVRKLMDPDYAYLRTADGSLSYTNGKIR